MKRLGSKNRARKSMAVLVCAALAVAGFAGALCGCVKSDTVTQKEYETNTDDPVDESLPKVLINSEQAKKTSDQLPRIGDSKDADRVDDTAEKTPVYQEKKTPTTQTSVPLPNNADTKADQAGEAQTTSASGNGVKTKKTKSGNASKVSKGKKSSSKKQGDEKKDGDDGGDKGDNTYVKDWGDVAEIPEDVTEIAATGNAAVVVSMLGGTSTSTPLVAADKNFITKNSSVMAARGVSSSISALWSGDGDDESALSDSNFEKLTGKNKPGMILYVDGSCPFTNKQLKTLEKNGIYTWALSFKSSGDILESVTQVSQILENSGDDDLAELAKERAKDYNDFHEEIVNTFSDADKDSLTSLYISDWDYNASYPKDVFNCKYGVGIASLGTKNNPTWYYMKCAGVVNNAANNSWKSAKKNYASIVWQINQGGTTGASCKWTIWSSIDKSLATNDIGSNGNGFDDNLLYNTSKKVGAFSNSFPGVIVETRNMQTAMRKDMALDNGIYHPYPNVSAAGLSGPSVGYRVGDKTYETCIGVESGKSVLYDGITQDAEAVTAAVEYCQNHVYVNPHGLYCSWTQGSVESVLETPWVYSAVAKSGDEGTETIRTSYGDTPKEVTSYFYKTFYGYEGAIDSVFDGLKD